MTLRFWQRCCVWIQQLLEYVVASDLECEPDHEVAFV